ncbi:MAG TPA: hypothetical protein VHJ20_12345 [Polyangia bacterium]|nr:hypothetical protein [Polyangia bacterium]
MRLIRIPMPPRSSSGAKCGALILMVASFISTSAFAKEDATARQPAPEPERVQLLADVVVNGAQQPAPAPAPAPVVVQPQATAAPTPVVEPRHETVIEHEPHNYMSTIAVSALMGGVAGIVVGGAIYYLNDNRSHGDRILYWGAGGVLVGTAVGVAQVVSEESRLDRATSSNLPTDPAPTYRIALLRRSF